jgi:hypothetical protein
MASLSIDKLSVALPKPLLLASPSADTLSAAPPTPTHARSATAQTSLSTGSAIVLRRCHRSGQWPLQRPALRPPLAPRPNEAGSKKMKKSTPLSPPKRVPSLPGTQKNWMTSLSLEVGAGPAKAPIATAHLGETCKHTRGLGRRSPRGLPRRH